ncbi:MAG: hypothetical protein HOV81_08200 [Kofleriaceae bacterium]|nr:hypothetical protein [Kofleriaceae bacterium]
MPSTDLLAAARNALAAGLLDGCIDTAAIVHADPSASADERAQAAILAARGMIDKELWPDALVWCDRAGGREAEVAAYRGWILVQRGENEAAVAELERAVGPGVPPMAAWFRAVALDNVGRRADAYASLATIIEDKDAGALALRLRGMWRLQDGNRGEGIADLIVAARQGDVTSAGRLGEEEALPDDPEVRLAYAKAIASDDLDGATKELRRLLKRKTLAPALRAKILARLGLHANWGDEKDEAVEHYAAAVALVPGDRELLAQYGRALYNADRDDEGLVVLERARAMPAGEDSGLLDAQIEQYIADVHFIADRHAEAVELYERSLARRPRKADLMYGLSQALHFVDRTDDADAMRFAAAVAGDEDAIEACDEDVELPQSLHDNGCFGLGNHGEPNQVAETLGQAAELWLEHSRAWGDYCARHAAMALSNQSYALVKAERFEEGLAAVRRAVELRPGFRDGWINYGNQLEKAARFGEALAAFERASWCDPKYPGGYYGKSEVLRRMGDGDATVAALTRAAEIGYEDSSRQRDIHFRLARAYQALGKLEDAEREWRRMTELEGDEDYTAADAVAQIAELVANGADAYEPAPYRRYGLRPSTWHVSSSIAARLQLAAEPDDALREKLAEVIEETIVERAELAPEEAKFTGRFIEITVETDPDGDFPESAFEALEAAADAVHAIAPLVEAVGYSAIGLSDDDAGEQWSIATQPVPDAGPEPTYYVAFWPFAFAPQ